MEVGYSDGLASVGQVGIEITHLREMQEVPSDILVTYDYSEMSAGEPAHRTMECSAAIGSRVAG